ncbi:MAG: SRPBCC family protein [Sporichthyaceae bacterium]
MTQVSELTSGVTVHRECAATPGAVMEVLGDGWLFGLWVVGASHIRDVDAGWPAVGTKIHHSVGAWPLLIEDNTESLEYDPEGLLVLRARAWPVGEAQIRLEIERVDGGARMTMTEDVRRGPGRLLGPAAKVLFPPRNRESLARLAALAERRV